MALRLIKTVPWLTAATFFGSLACSGGEEPGGGDGDSSATTGGAQSNTGGGVGVGGLTGTGGAPDGTGGIVGTGGSASGGTNGTGGEVLTTGGAPSTGGVDPGTGGADPGTGGAPPEPTYTLTESGGVYTYSVGDSSMTIDPSRGGRVTSFVVAAEETLVQSGATTQDGSVFWPSPQTLFNWPPPPEIDSGTYAAAVSTDELTLTSANAATLGLTVTKVFAPTHSASGRPAISVTYTMTNTGASALAVAGWEISRVGPGGMAFFPTGPGGQLAASTLSGTVMGDHTWYAYDPTGLTGVPKIFADGSDGWLAWSTGEAVVIKSFPDVPLASFAPSESEIEIYAAPTADGNYFEVEQQGPLENIDAGGSATWTVLWIGVAIPDGASTDVGSADLATLVTSSL